MGGIIFGCIVELLVLGSCCCAIITNSLLLASCDLLTIQNNGVGGDRGSIGLYRATLTPILNGEEDLVEGYDGCVYVDDIPGIDDQKDAAFNCARVSAVLAFICGVVLLFFGFFKQCLCPLPCTQPIMDISGGTVQIFLALVYVIWHTGLCDDNYCTYGEGTTYLILTQIFWLTAWMFTRCMRPGRKERSQGEQ